MKRNLVLAITLIALSGSALAHHGATSQFDPSMIVKISGVVTDLGFVNPHSYVYLDVEDEDGIVSNWHCEMRAATVMKRSGWTADMFEAGTRVSIVGIASRREANGCYVETIAFNDGPPIERYAQIEEKKGEPDSQRPARAAWGDPFIGGDWAANQRLAGAVSGPNAGGGPPRRPRGGRVELTEAGTAASAANEEVRSDRVTGRLDCVSRDFFSDWIFDQHPNRIVQEKNRIELKYGFMDTARTIHMDISEHPAVLEPSWAGHSIGHWDNDVLVVDTTGFTASASRRSVHSEQFHTVERFSLDAAQNALNRSYVADDALFWKTEQTGQDTVYISDYPYEKYNCDDRTVE